MISALLILAAQHPAAIPQGLDPEWKGQVESLAGKVLGDPRSATYSRVQLAVDSRYPATRRDMVESEGWVLEGGKTAVLWDGLVYPISKVLGKADPRKAMTHALSDQQVSNPLDGPWGAANLNGMYRNQGAAALWFLLGEQDVSLRMLLNMNKSSSVHQFDARALPNWLAERFRGRVVSALKNFRDEEALGFAKIERDLRGTDETISFVGPHNTASQLVLDIERRLSNRGKKRDLLEEFEDIKFLPNMSPDVDPIMQKAIDFGPDIIPQLITRAAKDKRLTRAEVPSRNFPSRSIARVDQAFRYVLQVLWPEYAYYSGRTEDELQSVFARQKDLSTAERLMEIIGDSTMPDHAVVSALGQFVVRPYDRTPEAHREVRLAGPRFSSRIASAVEVRYRRLIEEFKKNPNQNPLAGAAKLSLALATFDYPLGQPLVRESTKLIVENLDRQMVGGERPRWDLINIFTLAAANEDSAILAAYTAFSARDDALEDFPSEVMPALRNPKNVQARYASSLIFRRAEEIVANEGSPGHAIRMLNLLLSRDIAQLIAAPQVRELLYKGLQNESSVVGRGQAGNYELPADRGTTYLSLPGSRSESVSISVADFVAHQLSAKFATGTDFDLKASEPDRLSDKKAIGRWLQRLPNVPLIYKDVLRVQGKLSKTGH